MTLLQEVHRLAGPDCPLAEEPAHDAPFESNFPLTLPYPPRGEGGDADKSKRRQQVHNDVVVVSGVKSDVVAAVLDDGADYILRSIAVKGGDFDRHDVVNLG